MVGELSGRGRSARVLLVDADGRVLLQKAASGHWYTPGGRLDPHETLTQGAVREIREETGLELAEDAFSGVLLERYVCFTLADGRQYEADESYVAAHVAAFTPDESGLEPGEELLIAEQRWWSVAEIRVATVPVWPEQLADLVEQVLATAAR
ncbi:MAG TPA: NUDIX domain-containing protein [Mycobacteriales bacterium]|nr:NUDIX domain-containing protein [Mycobacteriales bacterium]